MTKVGPLTSTLTPSAGCNSVVYGSVYTQFNRANISDSTTHKYHSLGFPSTSECYPPDFLATSAAFYSPGICPSGWVSACGSSETIGTATEIRATCCPSGYTCSIDPPSATATWSTLSCFSVAISAMNVTVTNLSNQQSIVTELDHPLIFAAGINVRWQKDDFALASSTPPPSSMSTPSTSISSSPARPTSVDSPGLSTGTKIGIGVGVSVGGLAILGAVGYMLKRRKTSSHGTATVKVESSDQCRIQGMAGDRNYNTGLPTQSNTSETDGRMMYPEMCTISNMPEMDRVSKPPMASTKS